MTVTTVLYKQKLHPIYQTTVDKHKQQQLHYIRIHKKKQRTYSPSMVISRLATWTSTVDGMTIIPLRSFVIRQNVTMSPTAGCRLTTTVALQKCRQQE